MNIIIERSEFLKALNHVRSVIEKRTTVPILSNILLEAGPGNAITLSATDLEISMTETFQAERVNVPGAITIPAQMLYDIVSRLPEDSLPEFSCQISSTGENAPFVITAGRSTFRLSTLPAEEYALIKRDPLPHTFTINMKDFGDLIDQTSYAISAEEMRYYLTGLYFELIVNDTGDTLLRSVATDGHRLAKSDAAGIKLQTPLPTDSEPFPGIIIPHKTVREVLKLLDTKEGEALISFSDKSITFTIGDIHLMSRLIDGQFPDYDQVIPKDNTLILEIKTKDFKAAVDRVSVMASDKTNTIKLMVGEGALTLSAANPHSGTAIEELEIDYQGSAFEMGFNATYLLDAVRTMKSDSFKMCMKDAFSAIRLEDDKMPGRIHVIMPMRV